MTPGELRALASHADMYKMSLGKSARFREEALRENVLVFYSETRFHKAVMSRNEDAILKAGRLVRAEKYPRGEAPEAAIAIWRHNINTFQTLPSHSIVVHWEGDRDRLYWGITERDFRFVREEPNEFGQMGMVFHRSLVGGWRTKSIGGLLLSDLHPRARDISVNMATINRVQTDHDYLRALMLDEDTSEWENRLEWREKARDAGWRPKPRRVLLAERRKKIITPLVVQIAEDWMADADYWNAEISRMAATAVHTAEYADGRTLITTAKTKELGFTREKLEEEIAYLLEKQNNRCALTDYDFTKKSSNPHLRPSLDRKDSSIGYVPGNLQVVTRAANFFKSASDEHDWEMKAKAMHQMVLAMQSRRKEASLKVSSAATDPANSIDQPPTASQL